MIRKRMKISLMLLICVRVLAAQDASSQEVLTNEAIVELVKAKVSESVIVGMIQTLPARFSLTKDAIIKLKQQGLSDKVLAAMVAKRSSAPQSVPASTAAESRPMSSTEKIADSASADDCEIRDRKRRLCGDECKYPDTMIGFQVHAAGGRNWLEGKRFNIFVIFSDTKLGSYPIVYAAIPGPR